MWKEKVEVNDAPKGETSELKRGAVIDVDRKVCVFSAAAGVAVCVSELLGVVQRL